jgi:hypothetical protein
MRSAVLLATTLLLMPIVAWADDRDPLVTNRRSFFIPVTVDHASRDHVPTEVHLLVSADQGKTWSTYARQAADSKGFQFQARDDGQYWFASRTIDAAGKTRPSGEPETELKIVIDGTPPTIELDAAATGENDVKAAWRISDPNMAADGVRVEWQPGESLKPAWQAVAVEASQQKQAGGMLLGSVSWRPSGASRVIDIRLTATDRAGNTSQEVQRAFLPRKSPVALPKIPEFPGKAAAPVAERSNSPSGDPFAARQFGAGGTFQTRPLPPTTTPAAEPTLPAPPAQIESTAWPTDNKLHEPSKTTPNPNDKLAATPGLATEHLPKAIVPVEPLVSERVVARPASSGNNPARPIWSVDDVPPTATQTETEQPAPVVAPDRPPVSETSELPSGEKPQLTSGKSFSLEYDVDAVGPSGVRSVELWVTIDGGRSWEKWGEDEDRRSPFDIQVQSERTFGFRMVIVANNGLATRTPEPGDTADLWVTVDSTQPTGRLLQAAYGRGEHAGQLDIRWEADDEHLGSRPISIAFSENPDGPFTTLAAGLPNTGQYFWTIEPQTPRSLYLRLEVRDEAGNLKVDQTAEPVNLEGLSPKGRIRGVVPAGQAGAFRSPLFR